MHGKPDSAGPGEAVQGSPTFAGKSNTVRFMLYKLNSVKYSGHRIEHR
jgi:hypothetical protein